MLKIIVCDDDRTYLTEVTDMLKSFFSNQGIEANISGYISVDELMKCCKEKDKPDLCFLDIEMGNENGIDAARSFNLR
jgi:DNA-binding LytR/AlgR family response regulator